MTRVRGLDLPSNGTIPHEGGKKTTGNGGQTSLPQQDQEPKLTREDEAYEAEEKWRVLKSEAGESSKSLREEEIQ